MKERTVRAASSSPDMKNIFTLDGKVPFWKSVPFGLQHVLAMFVANLAPITLIAACAAPSLESWQLTAILQNAMFMAGIGTLIQLFPKFRLGSGLPIVMGVSFTFVALYSSIAATYGYGAVVGATIVGGIVEGVLGLLAKYWRKLIPPIVAATVVTAIGFSLFPVGARSFGGGYGPDFGSAENLILGSFTLAVCLIWTIKAKGFYKQLAVLAGLLSGYVLAIFMGKVDFSFITEASFIALPQLLPVKPVFLLGPILSAIVIYLVSAAETIGDTAAIANGGLGRDVMEKEISGSLSCDGFLSSVAGWFSVPPVTSFSQNVGLVAMTKVVNRYTIATGAGAMILAAFFPWIGGFFASLPESVLGGCTIMMFGTIVTSGMQMITRCGFSQRNVTIAALSLAVGIGFTTISETEIWHIFPEAIQTVFANNVVAVVFVVAVVMNLVLPKDWGKEEEQNHG